MTTMVQYRASRGSLRAMYTWSRVIDNQSEPLRGDFFNLSFTGLSANTELSGRAAFPIQFDPLSDRGNSDFDQRHNFVILSYWNLPALLHSSKAGVLFRNWTVSQLAAFRSGSPYTLAGATSAAKGIGLIWNNRPDLIQPDAAVLAQ